MKIAIKNTLELRQIKALVIPVVGNGAHEATLKAVEKTTGISAEMLRQDFKGEIGEILPLYLEGQRIYLLGLGEKPAFADVLKAFRSFSHKMKKKLTPEISVSFLHDNLADTPERWVEAAANGLVLGAYYLGRYKTKNAEHHPFESENSEIQIFIDKIDVKVAQAAAARGQRIAETQMSIYDLVNAPNNKKIPADLANWALESGKKYGYRVEVWDKQQIEATGLNALLAVNAGSEHPPTFIIMEYVPDTKPVRKVGLVGKGVTFDTGGLSIKPSNNMHLMKSDMGGAAAVFGTMEAVAKFKLPVHLIGIVPATDNAVDAHAFKPSDVIHSYSGKTIEVIDTDAEGRLILADGLAYMVKHFQPQILIDLATLTGSSVRTFGSHAGALFSNNDALADQLVKTSEQTGERVWRLPVWEVYKDEMKSEIADIRNLGLKPTAGAITAAKFLEFFTDEHPAWAHLDIAGVALVDSEFSPQRSATAFGVRLLLEFLEDIAKEP